MQGTTQAALITPVLNTLGVGEPPYMVKFWYHAWGADVGTFELFEFDGTTETGPLWTAPASTAGETRRSSSAYKQTEPSIRLRIRAGFFLQMSANPVSKPNVATPCVK